MTKALVQDPSVDQQPDRIYDLKRGSQNSNEFYRQLKALSDRVLLEVEFRAAPILDEHSGSLLSQKQESLRSRGDYALELLTLGMALRLYSSAAASTSSRAVFSARAFLHLRRLWPRLKPAADLVRACIFRYWFATPNASGPADFLRLDRLPRLLRWMEATGEFDQEVARLHLWHDHLRSSGTHAASSCLRTAVGLFDWFSAEAADALGSYTNGVRPFLGTEYLRRGIREDRFFCGRRPAEYHLGMVAAEVMNEALRPSFEKTPQRALLVPTCMRGARAERCLARVEGLDITCAGCDPQCNVNRISHRMREKGIPVFLVPHATGFSRWLRRWQQEPDVGVVAVACALNILPGGYEMRARGIPSQCLPLDHPGCEKHWCRSRTPTCVNEERLIHVVTSGETGRAPA